MNHPNGSVGGGGSGRPLPRSSPRGVTAASSAASAVAAAAPPAKGSTVKAPKRMYYTEVEDETPSSIAQAGGLSVEDLVELNKARFPELTPSAKLKQGTGPLYLPVARRSRSHRVGAGTSASSASSAAGVASSSAGTASKGKGKDKTRRRRSSPAASSGRAASASPAKGAAAASSTAALKQRIIDCQMPLWSRAVGVGNKIEDARNELAPFIRDTAKHPLPRDCDDNVFPANVDIQGVLMLYQLVILDGRSPRVSAGRAIKKAKKLLDSERFGAILCDPAGVGKTATVWMFLTLLKVRGHIDPGRPVLLIAPGSGGNIRDQWWEEYLYVHPTDGTEETEAGELDICWVDPELCGKKPNNDFLDTNSPHGPSDVYVLSEKQFTVHGQKLSKWVKHKRFELVVIDEAHGAGTTNHEGKASGLQRRVASLYKKLPKIQVLLISSNPGWESGNEALFREAIGLSGREKLELRVLERSITAFNMPKVKHCHFPQIDADQSEWARIRAASPQKIAVSKLRASTPKQPNVQELATTLPFNRQAEVLAKQVIQNGTEQWAIWAISKLESKEELRTYLTGKGIKCSPIYHAKISPEDFAAAVMQDTSLQVIFPPDSHERGMNLYKDVKNCVFWDESEGQWSNEGRHNQVETRHRRRDTINKVVMIWRFLLAPDHPHSKLVEAPKRTGGRVTALGPIREEAMARLCAKLAAAGPGPAPSSSMASSSSAAAAGGKRKRKRPNRGAGAAPALAAASPTSSGVPGKLKRSTSEASLAPPPGPPAAGGILGQVEQIKTALNIATPATQMVNVITEASTMLGIAGTGTIQEQIAELFRLLGL